MHIFLPVGNSIHFRFDVGNGIQTLEKTTAYPLNDDTWHTVHVERNRKQAMLKVDTQAMVLKDEPTNQGFRSLILTSALVIGEFPRLELVYNLTNLYALFLQPVILGFFVY